MVKILDSTFSQAEKLAAVTFVLALFLFFLAPAYAQLPLLFFLILCFIAPFFPQWGFFLPVVSSGKTEHKAVALTFDDGPFPSSTPVLLQLLKKYNYKATFFVVGNKAKKHPRLITDIVADGHTIGNHSWCHDSLLMLRSRKNLRQDIEKTQKILAESGVRPLVFRPPAGITNPRLKSVLFKEKLMAVTFSCRAFDHGNRKISNLAERILRRLKPGDIILLHDIPPEQPNKFKEWEKEIHTLFSTLQKNHQEVVPLEQLIGSEVMLMTDAIGIDDSLAET